MPEAPLPGAATEERKRTLRALRERRGQPLIGYLCCFAPPEMIEAAGAIPYRITGRPGGDTGAAEAYLEPYGCPYVRNIFAQALQGQLDFLDGLVISHSCDMVQRLYGIWTYYRPPAYRYLFNVPHRVTPWGRRFYERELVFFRESLERFTGRQATAAALQEAVERSNRNRALLRRLYTLRREEVPRPAGSSIMELLLDGSALPADLFTGLIEKELAAAEAHQGRGPGGPRLMVWGSIIDDPAFYRMIEAAGGDIVADDTCIGFRTWEQDIPAGGDPYRSLAEHYFAAFQCPRTDRGPGLSRFAYLLQRARDYRIDGVIAYLMSFCDPHKLDYPDLRDYLRQAGLPLLPVDDNYSFAPAGAIATRLQAFVEMLGDG